MGEGYEVVDGIEWPYRARDGFAGWASVYRDSLTGETFYGCRRCPRHFDKLLYRLRVFIKPKRKS